MKQNFIFILILFTTLSVVNAIPYQLHKRASQFVKCPEAPPDAVTLSVSISPDPVVPGKPDQFTVSGKLNKDITEETVVEVNFGDGDGILVGEPFQEPICTGDIKCPIPAGTEFKKVINPTVPGELPDPYVIAALVGIPPKVPGDSGTVNGCAIFASNGKVPPTGTTLSIS